MRDGAGWPGSPDLSGTGRIEFEGHDVTGERPYQRVRRGMSMKMQAPSVFLALTDPHPLSCVLLPTTI